MTYNIYVVDASVVNIVKYSKGENHGYQCKFGPNNWSLGQRH